MKTITLLALVFTTTFFAQSNYEKGMQKAFDLWTANKATDAAAMFERVAGAEKNNWLPNYYVALVNVTESFKPENKDNVAAMVAKAQAALDASSQISPNNSEILCLQALINTVLIIQDPMVNGMKLSAPTIELYNKAIALSPNNPRAVIGKADFQIGGAKWTGADVKALCKEVDRAIELFATFKPETPFHPTWGLERAKETQANCKK